jgi:hypothetical protein
VDLASDPQLFTTKRYTFLYFSNTQLTVLMELYHPLSQIVNRQVADKGIQILIWIDILAATVIGHV